MKRYRPEVGACGRDTHRIDYSQRADGEFIRWADFEAFCLNIQEHYVARSELHTVQNPFDSWVFDVVTDAYLGKQDRNKS